MMEPLYSEFDDRTTPDWLYTAVDKIDDVQRHLIPNWINLSELPPIWINSSTLNRVQVESLIVALESSTLEHVHPLVRDLRTHAKKESLDAFVCQLFEQWRAKRKAIKDKWAMMAMGLLGSDMAAHKLGPLVYTWRNELKHQYVTWGLECLQAIGTTAALMELHAIAQKTRHTALKQRVYSFLTDIAHQLKLTQEELQDRIVPDCGLNKDGSHIFDFGSRQFELVLTTEKPMVRVSTGKLKSNLPKPGVKDRADLAQQAIAEWRLMKKQIAQVFKIKSLRLEQAMVNERRWQMDIFEMLFVLHPLMIHLTQRLIWGHYDASQQLVKTFRVTENRTYADLDDKTYQIEESAMVGIVHPLHLSLEQRFTWGELLSDYEIVQPFAQSGRSLYTLELGEEMQTEITRFADIKVEAIALVGILERRGWTRGLTQDGGMFYEHSKLFEGANVIVFIEYDGIPIYSVIDGDVQSIQRCFFVSGNAQHYPNSRKALSLSQVNPIVISEVLGDLITIAAKSK